MPVKSRSQKVDEQSSISVQQAISSASQAHTAVNQAQSSLLPQDIQYAEHKVNEALSRVHHVKQQLGTSISADQHSDLQQAEETLLQDYQLFN